MGERDGFMHSEAAGVLVLEAWEHAEERGVPILAEFLGSASTADAHHITAHRPRWHGCCEVYGIGARRCRARRPPTLPTSTPTAHRRPLNDAAEAEAVTKVFGENTPPMTSTKGVTGHALGAAGAIEAVAMVLAMHHRQIPPTHGTSAVDPELPQVNLVLGRCPRVGTGPSA